MSYFSELGEKRLHRRIKKVRNQGGEPIVKKLHKDVLYEEDAYGIIRKYVYIAFNGICPSNLLMTNYDCKSGLLKLVSEPQECKEHYWLYIHDGLYFMVEIGLDSKIHIGREICLPVSRVGLGFAYIKVPLKNCKWQLGVPSMLYGYFMYSEAGLEPIALMLEGRNVDVEDFDESVWNARVEYTPKKHYLEGYDKRYGHKGSWYDVWFSIAKRGPIFDQEEADHLPINAHERWWKGEKIIRQFEADKRPTLTDMMVIWDQFRKSV